MSTTPGSGSAPHPIRSAAVAGVVAHLPNAIGLLMYGLAILILLAVGQAFVDGSVLRAIAAVVGAGGPVAVVAKRAFEQAS